MAIYCSCTCGKIVRFPDKAAGRRYRCPKCRMALAVPAAPTREEGEDEPLPSAEGRGVFTPEDGVSRTFWQDLLKSPFFVFEQSNLVALLFVAAAHCILGVLSYLFFAYIPSLRFPSRRPWFLTRSGLLGPATCTPIALFLGAYYLSTIRQIAGGEDDLPDLWPTRDEDDAAEPLVDFVGSWAAALGPATILHVSTYFLELPTPLWVIQALFLTGFLLWPSTVLTVSLGGGIRNLLPRYVALVIYSSPLAYLAVCLAVLLACGLTCVPYFIPIQRCSLSVGAVVVIFAGVLTAYAGLVGMRAVGLYYRHYKRDWPWFAE